MATIKIPAITAPGLFNKKKGNLFNCHGITHGKEQVGLIR